MDAYYAFMKRTCDAFEKIRHAGFLSAHMMFNGKCHNVPAEALICTFADNSNSSYGWNDECKLSQYDRQCYHDCCHIVGNNYFNPLEIMPEYIDRLLDIDNYALISAIHWTPQQVRKYCTSSWNFDFVSRYMNVGKVNVESTDSPLWLPMDLSALHENKQYGDFDVSKFITNRDEPDVIIDEFKMPEIEPSESLDNIYEQLQPLFANRSMTWHTANELLNAHVYNHPEFNISDSAANDRQLRKLYNIITSNPMDHYRNKYLLAACEDM